MAGSRKGRVVKSDSPEFPNLRPHKESFEGAERERIVRKVLDDPGAISSVWAPIVSPKLQGMPTAPTAIEGTRTEQLATTRFVGTAIDTLTTDIGSTYLTIVDAASTYLTITDAASTYLTIADAASDYLAIGASAGGDLTGTYPNPTIKSSVALSGNPTTTTQSGGDNSTKVATTAFVHGELAAYAPLASPVLTGNPTAPTPSANDNDTSIATTAYVQTEIGSMGTWTIAATAPGSPASGDVWVYQGSGFYWMFVYDSTETTYKWKFIGGGWLAASVATDESFTDDGAYHDPATAGPTVTLPFAGDYTFSAECDMYIASQSANARNLIAKLVASSGSWDTTSSGDTVAQQSVAASSGHGVSVPITDILRGVSASATAKMQYQCAADTGTSHTRWRHNRCQPIRVI